MNPTRPAAKAASLPVTPAQLGVALAAGGVGLRGLLGRLSRPPRRPDGPDPGGLPGVGLPAKLAAEGGLPDVPADPFAPPPAAAPPPAEGGLMARLGGLYSGTIGPGLDAAAGWVDQNPGKALGGAALGGLGAYGLWRATRPDDEDEPPVKLGAALRAAAARR